MIRNSFFAALLMSGAMVACSDQPTGEATKDTTEKINDTKQDLAAASNDGQEALRREREDALKELRDMREDLMRKLAGEKDRLAEGIKDKEKKAECEARIAELEANVKRTDAAIANVDAANNETWNNVKADTRKTVDDTKNWIQREAEKIDWKTKADADKDGH